MEAKWQPCTEAKLWQMIRNGIPNLNGSESEYFNAIRVEPERWELDPWGTPGNGFWAIAVIGQNVCWYNDIEDGFNLSTYSRYGQIGEYWCDQDEFDVAIRKLKASMETGISHVKCGPPQSIE